MDVSDGVTVNWTSFLSPSAQLAVGCTNDDLKMYLALEHTKYELVPANSVALLCSSYVKSLDMTGKATLIRKFTLVIAPSTVTTYALSWGPH